MGHDHLDCEIIRVGEAEVPALSKLLTWRRTSSKSLPQGVAEHEHNLGKMRAHINSDSLLVWAALLEDRLVGYVSVAKILKPDGRVYFYIDELWVPDPFRRRGIALSLLNQVVQAAQETGVWCIRLVAADSEAACKLYQKAGFRVEPSGWSEMML